MWMTRVSIQNPVFAAMVMVALCVLGLFSYSKLGVEQMPDITFPGAWVEIGYPGASPEELLDARRRISELYMDERIVDYIVELVHATRYPAEVGVPDLKPLIEFGASPRATIALGQAARAHAFLRGRAFVTPDDVTSIAPDVLRHRVLTTFEADAEGVTSDAIVARILAAVDAP